MKNAFRSKGSQTLGWQWLPNAGTGSPDKRWLTGMRMPAILLACSLVFGSLTTAVAGPGASSLPSAHADAAARSVSPVQYRGRFDHPTVRGAIVD